MAEKYLNCSQTGLEVAEFFRLHRGRFGGSEYPVVVVVAAWNAIVEEEILNQEAIFAPYNTQQILQRLETSLRIANTATMKLPQYEIIFESPTPTRTLIPGSRIRAIFMHWGRRHINIMPPSIEGTLLLCCLLSHRNHYIDLDSLVSIHNMIPFYWQYRSKTREVNYKAMKERLSRLRHFLNRHLGEVIAGRILQEANLEDDRSCAYRVLGKSVKFVPSDSKI